MGWSPYPRWNRKRRLWMFTLDGKRYTARARADIFAIYGDLISRQPLKVGTPTTVAELSEAYQHAQNRPWLKWVLADWERQDGKKLLCELPPNSLVLLRDRIVKAKAAPRTIKHKVGGAMRCLKWGEEHGYLSTLPRMPKLRKIVANPRDIPARQLKKAFAKLPDRPRNLLAFILFTGCRPSEARLAKWTAIDLDKRRWHIPTSKTGVGRTVELTAEAVETLKHVADKYGSMKSYVFKSRLGKPYTKHGIYSIAERRGFVPYQLRHTFAQSALGQTDMATVAAMLGHKNLSTVQVYAQVRQHHLREAASTLVSPLTQSLDARSARATDDSSVASDPPRKTKPRQRKRAIGR